MIVEKLGIHRRIRKVKTISISNEVKTRIYSTYNTTTEKTTVARPQNRKMT
jgi:hypothetical protein